MPWIYVSTIKKTSKTQTSLIDFTRVLKSLSINAIRPNKNKYWITLDRCIYMRISMLDDTGNN